MTVIGRDPSRSRKLRPAASSRCKVGPRRLELIGSVRAAAITAATWLIRNMTMERTPDEGFSEIVRIGQQYPERAREVHGDIVVFILECFEEKKYEQLMFDFTAGCHPELADFARRRVGSGTIWPERAILSIACRDGHVEVALYPRGRGYKEKPQVLYRARLLNAV